MDSIYVTKPFLPDLNDYIHLLEEVWDTGIVTHNGPMVRKLEEELIKTLDIPSCCLVTNGTLALQIAIRALNLQGEIITTPFSWVATISAIKWEGCNPVFCDVDTETFNIDPGKIEELITDRTVAIMPVHVFGVPCDIKKIEYIANKYDLKVIYDAAHALGSKIHGNSILSFGDISASSLHGTKIFNTAEGGLCVTNDIRNAERLKRIRFFGHNNSKVVVEDGINAKMTEIHAALGLSSIGFLDKIIQDRKEKYFLYRNLLSGFDCIRFQKLNGEPNYSYFPVVFNSERLLLDVENSLNKNNIFPRRYFHPSLNELSNIVDYSSMYNSEILSRTILCLPLYFDLPLEVIRKICNIISKVLNENCID